MKMIDVGGKPPTERVAVARALLVMSKATRARVAARLVFTQAFPSTVELIPPKGHNAIVCGLTKARPLAEVQHHMASLPKSAQRAMKAVRALLGGTWPAVGAA